MCCLTFIHGILGTNTDNWWSRFDAQLNELSASRFCHRKYYFKLTLDGLACRERIWIPWQVGFIFPKLYLIVNGFPFYFRKDKCAFQARVHEPQKAIPDCYKCTQNFQIMRTVRVLPLQFSIWFVVSFSVADAKSCQEVWAALFFRSFFGNRISLWIG